MSRYNTIRNGVRNEMIEPCDEQRRRSSPTIRDVAKVAGVSAMTVSRVINGEGYVRSDTKRRVEQAIVALDYSPSAAAQMLAAGDQIRIGLLYSNPSFGFLNAFLVGSLDQASRLKVQLIVERCVDGRGELAALNHLLQARIDGLVIAPPLSESPLVLAVLTGVDTPVVAVAAGNVPDWMLSVSIDDTRAAYEMTWHLAALGHRRIGFIAGDPRQTATSARLAGYRTAMADCGLVADVELVASGLFTYRSGLDAAEQLLDCAEPPTAIFASNDDMAAATVAIAHRRRLDVPGDLTVCGIDDTALATTIWPELTTMRQPVTEMSRIAVDLLVRTIKERRAKTVGAAKHIVVAHELIRRQSDAAPRRRRATERLC